MNSKQKKMTLWVLLSIPVLVVTGVLSFLAHPSFGKLPSGERLARIQQSPNYRNRIFHNQIPTPMMTGERSRWQALWDFAFGNREGLRPDKVVPVIRTDLKQLPQEQNLMVWFGHSSYLLQVDGKRILVDPVFHAAAPVAFVNRPFSGTDIFHTEDMPDIDLLVITHDHWDHLDYQTVTELREKVGTVVCPLGVGSHFEYWGYNKEQLIELDWEENFRYSSLVVHCLPSRHFSGRGLSSNKTLWASFLLESASLTLFLGGDGGYGPHFRKIGKNFPSIDWAILENGQYSKDWKYIHTMPEQLGKIASDLNAKRVVTIHHSKYALSKHPWDEPIKTVKSLRGREKQNVSIPVIGEVLLLDINQP